MIYFDLDGTLADTRADLAATVNHARSDLGLEPLAVEEVIANVGLGARYLLKESVPAGLIGPEKLIEIFMSHYLEHALEKVTLYPGVIDTLQTLAERGWRLGVNTAKPRQATEMILDHFGLRRFFGEAVIAGGDGFAMKPAAEPLFACAAKAGHQVGPGDWMVGDNWTDVGCAAKAGVGSIFCDFGFGVLGDEKPTARARCFADILDIVAAPAASLAIARSVGGEDDADRDTYSAGGKVEVKHGK